MRCIRQQDDTGQLTEEEGCGGRLIARSSREKDSPFVKSMQTIDLLVNPFENENRSN